MTAYQKSSPAQQFLPSQECLSRIPHGCPTQLEMGHRQVYVLNRNGEQQFFVFKDGFNAASDPDCKNVIGSGFTPENALVSAMIYLRRVQLLPTDFWPRLKGCTFATAHDNTNILKHTVLDANGLEVGRGEYRESAASKALHCVLSNADDVSFDEFKAIAVVARLQRGGRKSYGWVYTDDGGQDRVRAIVNIGFEANSSFRVAAAACLEKHTLKQALAGQKSISTLARKPGHDHMAPPNVEPEQRQLIKALVDGVNECLLSTFDNEALITCPLIPENEKWIGYIVGHTDKITPETALRIAYEEFTASRQESRPQESEVSGCSG